MIRAGRLFVFATRTYNASMTHYAITRTRARRADRPMGPAASIIARG